MNPPDEAETWLQAIAGDGAAFAAVFDAHHLRVVRHARRLTPDTHDAEDVMAAAFLELWRRRHKVRVVDGSVLPWLLVTVTNLALNHSRGLRRHRAFIEGLPRGSTDQRGVIDEPGSLAIDPELLATISRLRPVDQELLALVALEGYPLAAASKVLGMTEHAGRSRWQRIRRRVSAEHSPAHISLSIEY